MTKKFKIKTYKEIEDAPNNSFDVVIIISVLEHVTDPVNFLKSLSFLLKRKGKIIIECPSINDPLVKIYSNQSYKNFYYRPVHINYFNKTHLQKLPKQYPNQTKLHRHNQEMRNILKTQIKNKNIKRKT